MFGKLKKQIRKLYISSALFNLSLCGAWVALLSARGFSLVEIGFAETVFHIASLIFEIPSGVLADVFGRKKMLLFSCLFGMIGSFIMIFSGSFFSICVCMVFQALRYNFSSGSDEALAYDSLKQAGEEARFEKYASTQMIIYRVCDGLSTLSAGFALIIGYRLAYASDILMGFLQLCVVSTLYEIRGVDHSGSGSPTALLSMIGNGFRETFSFLFREKRLWLLMFVNSLVGAFDILLLFFLQAKLPATGMPQTLLGPALLLMSLGGAAGSLLIVRLPKIPYPLLFTASLLLIFGGIGLEHTGIFYLMTLGGFIAAFADDALQIRTNARLEQAFPSEQRAALVSVESFIFSSVMIILSPLAGWFFTIW